LFESSQTALYAQAPALLFAWASWCFLHSLLAGRRIRNRLISRLHLSPQHYRLGYVLFSTLTVAALFYWQLLRVSPPAPAGVMWQMVRLLFGIYGFYMLAAGGRAYDLREFLGLVPLSEDLKPIHFTREGILGKVRHPWYSGGIALVIAIGNTPLDRWDWRLLLIVYLVVGCLIEERRLVNELGRVYRRYRKEVPMLIPRIKPKKK